VSKKAGLPDDYFSEIVGTATAPGTVKPPMRTARKPRSGQAGGPESRGGAKKKALAAPKTRSSSSAKTARSSARTARVPDAQVLAPAPRDAPLARAEVSEEAFALEELKDAGSVEGVLGIISDLEEQLESAYAMRAALEQDLAQVNEEVGRLRQADEEQKRRIRYFEAKIPDLDVLKEELEFAEREKSQAQKTILELRTDIEAKNQKLADQAEEAERMKALLKEARAANVKLESDLVGLAERNANLRVLEEECPRLQRENRQLAERVEELESELGRARGDLAGLGKDLVLVKETIGRTQADCAKQASRCAMLEQENRRLLERIAALQGENGELRPKVARLEKDLRATREENQNLQTEIAAARKTMKDIHAALAGAKAKVRQFESP
jgi:chromosome segregation ATPase